MNRKGQALVEFVLILPILIMIIFIIYDLGNIYNNKNILENRSNDIVYIYKNTKDINEIKDLYKDIDVSIEIENDYYKIKLSKDIEIIDPILGGIMGNTYKIEMERYIPYE